VGGGVKIEVGACERPFCAAGVLGADLGVK